MSNMATYSRNRLFTAMTRAKFKTYVYGVTGDVMTSFCDEYEEVKKNGYKLAFTYPTREKLKQMQSIAKIESEKMDAVQKVYKDVGDDSSVIKKKKKEQLGVSNIRELIEHLEKSTDDQ